MFIHYIGRIWHFAFGRFILRTDAMQVVAAVAIPAVAQIFDIINPEAMGSIIFSWIAYFSIAFIAIRAICAPYYVWREERIRADRLLVKLNSPQHKINEKLAEYRAGVLASVAKDVSQIIAYYQSNKIGGKDETDALKFMERCQEVSFSRPVYSALGVFQKTFGEPDDNIALWFSNLKARGDIVLRLIHDADYLQEILAEYEVDQLENQ